MKQILPLIKHELSNFLRHPSLWVLVLLPVFMSKIIISIMSGQDQQMMLLASWILFAQVMIGIMITGPNLIEERESKTIDALLVSPLSFRSILIAKSVTILLISLVSQLLVLFVNQGGLSGLWVLLLLMVAGGVFAIEIGILVGLHASSSKNGTALSSVLMVSLFLVGTIYQALPDWSALLKVIPSVDLVETMQSVLQNREYAWRETGILAIWLVFLTVWVELTIRKAVK